LFLEIPQLIIINICPINTFMVDIRYGGYRSGAVMDKEN
jgi:hypothetical protein